MSDTTDIVARLSGMSADHGPDGWPAVRMRDITALCEEVIRLRAELAEAQKLARDDFDLRAEQRDERDSLRAALAQAGAGREPVGWGQLGLRNGHTYVRMHYEGHLYPPPADVARNLNLVPLYAHPSPAQREPLSEARVNALIEDAQDAFYPADMQPHLERAIARAAEAACAAAWGVKLADNGTKGAA